MTDAEERLLIDPNSYLVDCFRLARRIWDDGYRPDFLVGLWRGGAPPGVVIQEFFRWKGHDPYHTAIRTQSLEGVSHGEGFDIKGFGHVLDEVQADDQLLLVDDFFDTGRTIYEVLRHLRHQARRNTPEVKVAVVANRVREYTLIFEQLDEYLNGMRIPYIAAFREAQNYIRAYTRGLGVFELPEYLAWPEWEQWDPLVKYLNSRRSRP